VPDPDDGVLRLNTAALSRLGEVPGPSYDRATLRTGIVHIGVGGFHRAHEAMFVDRLLEAGAGDGWGICGVGLLPRDSRMRDILRAQDHLFTLVLKHPDGRLEPQVIGSLVDYLFAPDDPEAVIERMASPEVRIVSLTLTEGGYHVDPATGEFDAAAANTPAGLPATEPLTAFGLVVEALVRRRHRRLPPFTVLSTDNLQRNGDTARAAFAAAAALRSPDLGAWVRDEVSFPNSMVDRITPGTTDDDRKALEQQFGLQDGWPVVAEPFVQWVLEDAFGDDRPAWDKVGVQLVDDVDPYEQMKLRMLNAGHQSIGYLGYLAGYRYTDEVLADQDFSAFLSGYLWNEAMPTVPPVPGVNLDDYARTLLERFGNPAVRDTLLRLCTEGSDRIRTFVLPVVRDRLARGEGISHAALVVAAWARFAEEVDEQGEAIPVVDRLLDEIRPAAQRQRDDPTAVLADTGIVGDLAYDPIFVEAFTASLRRLHADGARATVARMVGP
jgi:mannitol 2-dehydrogenase